MSRKGLVISAAVVLGAIATFVPLRDAEACGGCFGPPPPPTESPTVVTDHRMILTISKDQSTLYDQIRYQGSPASFAWVLPIAGTVDVGLSANIVFTALDQYTQQTIVAPPLNCPPQPSNCNFGARNAAASDGAGSSSGGSGGVTVLKEEVVGPYETVQLKSDDPNALNTWLEQNGFTIGDDVKPVIAQYVTEKFNFLALKLVPGKGVQDMRPVRVTTTGAGAVLPLRMVAAGTGPTVGITLWTIAEGRYEPQNFPQFYIKTDELIWDWNQQKSNYIDLRAQKTTAGAGRAWETESSQIVYRQNVEAVVSQPSYYGGGSSGGAAQQYPTTPEEIAATNYLAVEDDQGNVIKTALQIQKEDMDTLFYGIPTATSRVTRMRADLSHAALDQDLQMTASSDQEVLSAYRQVTKELNQPQCPVWDGCQSVGTAPRDEAFARSTPANGSSSCSTTTSHMNPSWLAIGGSLAAVGLVHVARRRRSKK
jgi:hypothetical protein